MKRRVAVCIPCLLVGGTEMHTLALARALVEGAYSVTVCVYYEHDPVMVREMERTGARVRLLGLTRTAGSRNFTGMPGLAISLARLFVRERPHFVHVQYMAPGALPILIAKLCQVPRVFATVHVPGHAAGRKIWVARRAARLCDAFLCVSKVSEKSFFGRSALFDEEMLRNGRRHFTIHNSVDLAKADEIAASGRGQARRSDLGLDGHFVVGVVGRLRSEKGQKWLLDAMREVVRRLPAARLLLVGDGPDRTALVRHAERIGLRDNVVWVGKVPHDEALVYVGMMDVVAVPSMWEGFGLSAAEAMAFGKAVVASDVDGLREVVEEGVTGRLVPYGDVRGMAGAILDLLRDPDRAKDMGAQGRSRAERLFSRAVFAERYLRLYRALNPSRGQTQQPQTALDEVEAG